MTINKGRLHAALARLLRIISRTSTMPILQHVKLVADGTTLTIEATDLTTFALVTLPCDGSFSACLPARALAEFVKPEDANDKQRIVELLPECGNKISVAVEAALTTIFSTPASDFPFRPSDKLKTKAWVHQGTWDAAEFSDKVAWVVLAASQDVTRAHLTGVFFDQHDVVVATDGHRLHMARLAGMASGPTLIDGRSVAALLGLAPRRGEVVVDRAGDVVRFTVGGDCKLETTAMTEKFPPYQQVIPSTEDFSVEVDRKSLLYAITRIAKSKGSKGLRIVANGAIRLERDNEEGSTSTTVPVVSTTHEGDDSVIGAEARYLVDTLSSGSEVVSVRFGDALSPIRFDLGDGSVSVVMPMRI